MKKPSPSSFTLVELLVVISIIGLLAGLAIPAIQGGLAAARKAESANQLKQLGTLAVAYTAENGGMFPEEVGEGLQAFTQLRNFPNAWYNVLPSMAGLWECLATRRCRQLKVSPLPKYRHTGGQ